MSVCLFCSDLSCLGCPCTLPVLANVFVLFPCICLCVMAVTVLLLFVSMLFVSLGWFTFVNAAINLQIFELAMDNA